MVSCLVDKAPAYKYRGPRLTLFRIFQNQTYFYVYFQQLFHGQLALWIVCLPINTEVHGSRPGMVCAILAANNIKNVRKTNVFLSFISSILPWSFGLVDKAPTCKYQGKRFKTQVSINEIQFSKYCKLGLKCFQWCQGAQVDKLRNSIICARRMAKLVKALVSWMCMQQQQRQHYYVYAMCQFTM